MKRNDFILIAIILAIAAAGLIYLNFAKKSGDMVVVKVDGAVYKELPLNKDTTLEIQVTGGGTNFLVIKDGHAIIEDASCPDKICVHHRQIEKDGESIICLPNKVVVEIEGSKQNEVDAVAD